MHLGSSCLSSLWATNTYGLLRVLFGSLWTGVPGQVKPSRFVVIPSSLTISIKTQCTHCKNPSLNDSLLGVVSWCTWIPGGMPTPVSLSTPSSRRRRCGPYRPPVSEGEEEAGRVRQGVTVSVGIGGVGVSSTQSGCSQTLVTSCKEKLLIWTCVRNLTIF